MGIGTTTPHPTAKLEIASTTQGFLPPRMTLAQRNAIASPAEGLIVFCYECDELQIYTAGKWNNMVRNTPCTISGLGIAICNQVWMKKNLDVLTYRNGDTIPKVTDATAWSNLTTGAWCWYNNDSATYAAIYGKLYNWYAVTDPRGLAPAGWHIPTDAEWTTLSTCLGGNTVAGGKLKALTNWNSPNTGATNSSGFSALGAGNRAADGSFGNFGNYSLMWNTNAANATNGNDITLSFADATMVFNNWSKKFGMSVRCVRD